MIKVVIIPNAQGTPPGQLATAELHFIGPDTLGSLATATMLDGLKLIGFGIWERRDGGRNVTFPARTYSVNGERRSFALLRPIEDYEASSRVRDRILEAYSEWEKSQ